MDQASSIAKAEAPSRAPRGRARRHRGGRPTLAEARRRQQQLLEVAGAMFMRQGFAGTSIDAVADAAGMSKRTVYARYADKNELFGAVLRELIERCVVPITRFQSGKLTLEPTLAEIGRHVLTNVLAPSAVSLHRIIIAESERQPAFGRLAHAEGRKPAVKAIAAVLRRHATELRVADFELAAQQFLSLVVDYSLCLATLGIKEDRRGIEARVSAAVDLFLNGAALPSFRSCSRRRG
jgi:TetR/AcrR family transcriptional regulator, mexJK operon transcriptional repressor